MIRSNRARFTVHSDVRTVAEITGLLGMEPTEAADVGDPKRAGRAARALKPQYLTHQRTFWSFDADQVSDDSEDETGFSALAALVAVLVPRADALAGLRADSETTLWWSGDSDSSQGGFVLTSELIEQLAILGCEVYGTTYFDDETADDDTVEFPHS